MKRHTLIALLVIAVTGSAALADGLVVPIRPDIRVTGHWAVKYHKVSVKVRDQVADVTIDQAFTNTGNGMIEVEYIFPLPPNAAIDALTLIVDGKEFQGKVLKADEARRIYESIVRQKKDPALLEYVDYGMYKTSAFPLQPGKDVRVVVHYSDVCKKDRDLVEVFYPLNTEKFSSRPIDEVEVKVDIQSKGDISAVYSPTHELTVKRPAANHVIATWNVQKQTPATDFRLLYQPAAEAVEATVLSYRPRDNEDGYFLMLASPRPRADKDAIAPKDLVVLLDRSGSMAGDKLEQAKASLSYVLKNLNKGDRFNVVVYCDSIDPLFEGLVDNTPENVDKALKMLDRVDARGGTNIHDSLATALGMLQKGAERSQYVLFLTDGRPTIGTTDEKAILKNTKSANASDARVFAMGIGYDVNVRLLDKLVRENKGVSGYVKEKEPLEAKISNLYAKIRNPVMTGLVASLVGSKTTMTYPQVLGDLFDGDQIVLVGRYDAPGKTDLLIKGRFMGKDVSFEYPVELAAKSDKFSYAFVEQLWAVRRIGFLLDQIQLNGESSEVVDELVRLSKQYGIITPYTSFLADERTELANARELRRRGEVMAKDLGGAVTGGEAQRHAANRADMNQTAQAPKAGKQTVYGSSTMDSYEGGQAEQIASVQNVGNRAFYKRGRQWIDASVSDKPVDKLNAEAREIRQFSDEYFTLVKANNAAENQILASQQQGEELVVALRGQVYRILPSDGG